MGDREDFLKPIEKVFSQDRKFKGYNSTEIENVPWNDYNLDFIITRQELKWR